MTLKVLVGVVQVFVFVACSKIFRKARPMEKEKKVIVLRRVPNYLMAHYYVVFPLKKLKKTRFFISATVLYISCVDLFSRGFFSRMSSS